MARRIIQVYRGTTAQNDAFTGESGELTMDTTRNELRLHDGSTAGGHVIPNKAETQGLLGGGTAGTVLTNSGTPGTVNATALATVATSGLYSDLSGTPTIPAAQVNSDWNAGSGVAEILNKPTTLSGYGITDGANTSLSNITSAGKQVCANMAMPSGNSVAVALGVSGASYTATANGYFNFRGMGTAFGQYAYIGDPYYSGVAYQRTTNGNNDWIVGTIPVKKGQSVIINYNTGANNALYFIKAEGEI